MGEALTLAQATADAALEAEVTPRAAHYALLAGERALGLDAARALDLLDRAKALTPEQDPAFPLVLLRWAVAAREGGRLPEAVEALERAIARFEAVGDVPHAGEALARLSSARWSLGEPDTIAIAERAVSLLEPTPGRELVDALSRVASSQYVSGSYVAAVETADRALALAAQLDLDVPGDALATRGFSRCYVGDLAGLVDTERGFDLLVAAGQGQSAATLLHNLACARWFLEGPAGGVATLEEALVFSDAHGLVESAQIHRASCSVFLVDNGRLDEGLAWADAILPQLRESGNRLFEHDVLAGQAVALDERGEKRPRTGRAGARHLPRNTRCRLSGVRDLGGSARSDRSRAYGRSEGATRRGRRLVRPRPLRVRAPSASACSGRRRPGRRQPARPPYRRFPRRRSEAAARASHGQGDPGGTRRRARQGCRPLRGRCRALGAIHGSDRTSPRPPRPGPLPRRRRRPQRGPAAPPGPRTLRPDGRPPPRRRMRHADRTGEQADLINDCSIVSAWSWAGLRIRRGHAPETLDRGSLRIEASGQSEPDKIRRCPLTSKASGGHVLLR